MSGKQWLSLLILFVGYLLAGAAVFWHIELNLEMERHAKELAEEEAVYELLVDNFNSSETSLENILEKLETYCGKDISPDEEAAQQYDWHFYNAVFFVITVVSTIGYGNLAPTCMLSRLLMIAYALIGIPLNGILLTHMANFFGHFFLNAHEKYKMHRIENRLGLIGNILLYLIPGFLVFIICPSFLFSVVEGWSFDQSVYYAFVTLTTIGFGDYVAGQSDDNGALYSLYKTFLILWVVFGLGYLVMLLGFITQALRSKRMARLEHKLSRNLKHTQNKLWNGFVSEIGYVRRVLNELYLMKVKPVYHDDDVSLATLQLPARGASCPDLHYLTQGAANPRKMSRAMAFRPRAYSEAFPNQKQLPRRSSETELAKINRQATFADTAPPADSGLDPAELLHEFMNALVNWGDGAEDVYDTLYKQAPGTAIQGGGFLGFPDADILSSERQPRATPVAPGPGARPRVSTPTLTPVPWGARARARAMSLAPSSAAASYLAEERARRDLVTTSRESQDGHESDESTLPADELPGSPDAAQYNAEWTWSGAAASKRVHELMRARQSRRRSEAASRGPPPPLARTTRSERKLQDLQQFQHQQYLEQLRQAARQRRQQVRSKSTSAADPDKGAPPPGPGPGPGPGLMTRLKELARRGSLQPPAPLAQHSTVTYGDLPSFRNRAQSASSERRPSAFSMRRDSCTAHPMLENTSLADFLRVLQSVHTQHTLTQSSAEKTRKLGTAGLQPPQPNSIFNLFPSLREDKDKEVKDKDKEVKDKEKDKEVKDKPRRMSLWPSVFSVDPIGTAGQATRKLSAMWGGGGPAEDSAALQPKPTKRRRFSIWPTLGHRGEEQPPSSSAAESGALPGAGLPERERPEYPQITVSYTTDAPTYPAPLQAVPPRETLRRIALTKPGVPRASLGDLPVIVASAAGGPVRRGPSLTTPVPPRDPSAEYRQRAYSDNSRGQGGSAEGEGEGEQQEPEDETYDVRL